MLVYTEKVFQELEEFLALYSVIILVVVDQEAVTLLILLEVFLVEAALLLTIAVQTLVAVVLYVLSGVLAVRFLLLIQEFCNVV